MGRNFARTGSLRALTGGGTCWLHRKAFFFSCKMATAISTPCEDFDLEELRRYRRLDPLRLRVRSSVGVKYERE